MKGRKTGGRNKGVENKVTKEIKESFKLIVENQVEKVDAAFDSLFLTNPEKAVSLLIQLSEYILPKLARTDTDITSKGEQVQLPTIQFVRTNDKDK
jgi:hypothetical protein